MRCFEYYKYNFWQSLLHTTCSHALPSQHEVRSEKCAFPGPISIAASESRTQARNNPHYETTATAKYSVLACGPSEVTSSTARCSLDTTSDAKTLVRATCKSGQAVLDNKTPHCITDPCVWQAQLLDGFLHADWPDIGSGLQGRVSGRFTCSLVQWDFVAL